jgi:hypothetical protein
MMPQLSYFPSKQMLRIAPMKSGLHLCFELRRFSDFMLWQPEWFGRVGYTVDRNNDPL